MTRKPPASPPQNKQRLVIGILLAVVLLGGIVSFMTNGGKSKKPAARKSEIVQITLPPPPPPPPPPPKIEPPKQEEPPKEEEMVEQEPVPDDEPPPEDSPPETPSEDLSTGIAGNGPNMGLSSGNGNGKIGGTGRKGGGSKYGWYAAKVQSSIAEALRRHPSTRNAKMVLQVRVWPDSNGRITRAQLVGSSGNPAVDQAIKNQILTGLQLPQAPPADMPVPIVLRITASKAAL